jgi:hypothetical protein
MVSFELLVVGLAVARQVDRISPVGTFEAVAIHSFAGGAFESGLTVAVATEVAFTPVKHVAVRGYGASLTRLIVADVGRGVHSNSL